MGSLEARRIADCRVRTARVVSLSSDQLPQAGRRGRQLWAPGRSARALFRHRTLLQRLLTERLRVEREERVDLPVVADDVPFRCDLVQPPHTRSPFATGAHLVRETGPPLARLRSPSPPPLAYAPDQPKDVTLLTI